MKPAAASTSAGFRDVPRLRKGVARLMGAEPCFQETFPISVEDEGEGIADIELAMKEGYSTASPEIREMGFGAGMGLPNIKKNSDEFHIRSVVGQGTFLEIYLRRQ